MRGEQMGKDYKNRITINPEIHFGKPCVVGTRITVDNVLELVEEGISFEEIIQNYYPELEKEDIKACIQFAIELIKSEEIHVEAS